MKILGIIGRADMPLVHDGSAALVVNNEIVCALEQERLTRKRYAEGQGAADVAKACLALTGLKLSDVDYIAYGWHVDIDLSSNLSDNAKAGGPDAVSARFRVKTGARLSDNVTVSDELTRIILPPDQFGYSEPPAVHFVQHHYAHAAITYYTSGFDSAAVLVIDGRGEGASITLYHAKGNEIELIESYPMIYSLGVFYSAAAARSGLGGHSGPGKLMGLAPFGQVRQEIDFSFDAETGRFTLPPPIRRAIDEASSPLISGDMWMFWYEYYGRYCYPYRQSKQSLDHIAHYADLAASVQHTLETICRCLAERVKKLTGEKNLVMSGGCALNCTMNGYLSRQNIFEKIYVFPAANDAGCSVGAALALSYTLDPPATPQERLIAPAFGRSYSDEEIAAAIGAHPFTPQKLSPDEMAERVATDLANDKIVAWFSGKDELGPRALGRRSFLGNPAHREMLGRLNQIKGREMWRPLAPSILDEQADTVLEGSMERGLHRYMLGVATIRSEWRPKVPAVVHIDFTTRPHFVQQEYDGFYWGMINKFYEKTGIPLVCNTSLNVAGQPPVHKPEQALGIFTTQDDVQTLVIEGFYLTKCKEERLAAETTQEPAHARPAKLAEVGSEDLVGERV